MRLYRELLSHAHYLETQADKRNQHIAYKQRELHEHDNLAQDEQQHLKQCEEYALDLVRQLRLSGEALKPVELTLAKVKHRKDA